MVAVEHVGEDRVEAVARTDDHGRQQVVVLVVGGGVVRENTFLSLPLSSP